MAKRRQVPKSKPRLSRTEVSVNWSSNTIRRLLQLIRDDDRYQRAFFPRGLIKYKVCDIAREVCIESLQDETEYMEVLEGREQVMRDGKGDWIPTDTWTSSYNNPIVTKFHDLKKRYKFATETYNIRPRWKKLNDVPVGLRKDFQSSYPWYFMFKALDDGSSEAIKSIPPKTTFTSKNAKKVKKAKDKSKKKANHEETSTAVAVPRPSSSNPMIQDQPASSIPDGAVSSSFVPRSHTPSLSAQIPIDIDADSVASDIEQDPADTYKEVIDLTIPRSKQQSSAKNLLRFRKAHGNLDVQDRTDLKELELQLRIATRKKVETDSAEVPSVFTHVPTKLKSYVGVNDESTRNDILRGARERLLFRVLSDLSRFVLPQCLTDCGVLMDESIVTNRAARARQLRQFITSVGGTVYQDESELDSDAAEKLCIYLYDDGQHVGDRNGDIGWTVDNQDNPYRNYTILKFGKFLRQRLFPTSY